MGSTCMNFRGIQSCQIWSALYNDTYQSWTRWKNSFIMCTKEEERVTHILGSCLHPLCDPHAPPPAADFIICLVTGERLTCILSLSFSLSSTPITSPPFSYFFPLLHTLRAYHKRAPWVQSATLYTILNAPCHRMRPKNLPNTSLISLKWRPILQWHPNDP